MTTLVSNVQWLVDYDGNAFIIHAVTGWIRSNCLYRRFVVMFVFHEYAGNIS